jgi:hypothetical protein
LFLRDLTTLPVPVFLNRLAAPRWVLTFGMLNPFSLAF